VRPEAFERYRTKHSFGTIPFAPPGIKGYRHDMSKTALIVEDELFIVLEVEDILRGAGYDRIIAYSAVASAMDWLEDNSADLAVVDYRLRDTTSEALVDRLIETATPTLIYSGNDFSEEFHDPAMKQFEWVSKPASPELLMSAIQRAAS
jgi:DNA-binding NtrC family response regulator